MRSREQEARRHAAPPPAQPRTYKGPIHRASFRPRHPRRGVLQGAATGAGVGENRVALRNRASRGGPIDGPRGHTESVVQRRLKRRTRVWGCGSVSQMWTELWVKCAQIHQMLYLFLRRPQNLVAIRLKVVKKEPGVMPGRLGLRTLVKPPS